MTLGIAAGLGSIGDTIPMDVGRCLPPMWGLMWGDGRCRPARPALFVCLARSHRVGLSGLEQTQLNSTPDGHPAAINVEFAVDALRMGADRTQSDDEFLSDLRSCKLRLEQA